MAYRVIIADDEPRIIQLVKILGHWAEYGIEIVDECKDGYETLDSIEKNHPDFVISDIKMPGLDGIELIEEARKKGSQALFVLLSGYRQFEYARSAVSLNVVDYLLKPVSEEQLNAALERICLQLKEMRAVSANQQEYDRMCHIQNQERQKQFWMTLMRHEDTPEDTARLSSAAACEKEFGIHFSEECFQVMQITTDMAVNVERKNSLFNQEVEMMLEQQFKNIADLSFTSYPIGYNVALNFCPDHQKEIRDAVYALYTGIIDLREIYGDFKLNIGISRIKNQISELREAMTEAQAASWGKFVIMHNGVLSFEQIADMHGNESGTLASAEEIEKISSCVKYLRREELSEVFKVLYQRAPQAELCGTIITADSYRTIKASVMCTASEESAELISHRFDYAYVNAKNYSQLMKMLYLQLDEYMQEEQKKMNQKARKPIIEAVQYINRHYADQISQTDVADASNVSTAYLSRLFKEEMNIGFIEYLTQIRLINAEKLLAGTNMTVKEIAVAVGYPDEKYFSKIYKKETGIKPSEYRKIYG